MVVSASGKRVELEVPDDAMDDDHIFGFEEVSLSDGLFVNPTPTAMTPAATNTPTLVPTSSLSPSPSPTLGPPVPGASERVSVTPTVPKTLTLVS